MKLTSLIRYLQHSVLIFVPALACASIASAAEVSENESPIIFQAQGGDKVSAFEGWLDVPENRQRSNSRNIKLKYVRFPSSNPSNKNAPPIIYLAGGPGGSGIETAKRQRFPLFMAMREFGDVIALDQRGLAEDRLPCLSNTTIPADEVVDNDRHTALYKKALKECLVKWQERGVDIYGYTTRESVLDLDALRQHLGAQKITLWGISYGSHLALAALKEMHNRIDRVVLASVEGLGQTIKLPARTDHYFDRLQTAIDADSGWKEKYPDVISLVRKVHDALDKKPLTMSISKNGTPVTIVFQKRDMQSVASSMIADPQSALMLLGIYTQLSHGKHDTLTQLLSQYAEPEKPIYFSGMSAAMDIASGITEERYKLVMQQIKTGLLADRLNFGLHHFDDIPGIDLGDSFRVDPISDVQTLVLSGTLDGRTYIESQAEAVAGLSNAKIIKIENAGHNLFMSSDEVGEAIKTFMRGEKLEKNIISIFLPENVAN